MSEISAKVTEVSTTPDATVVSIIRSDTGEREDFRFSPDATEQHIVDRIAHRLLKATTQNTIAPNLIGRVIYASDPVEEPAENAAQEQTPIDEPAA